MVNLLNSNHSLFLSNYLSHRIMGGIMVVKGDDRVSDQPLSANSGSKKRVRRMNYHGNKKSVATGMLSLFDDIHARRFITWLLQIMLSLDAML